MRYCFLLLGMISLLPQQVFAENPSIEVITNDSRPVSGLNDLKKEGINVRLYNLDEGKRLISRLEANLPKGEKAANRVMAQRIKNIGQPALQKMFSEAYQAVIVGTYHGLTRHPAIVFDNGRSVVYGVTDLTRALAMYRQWKVSNE